MFCVRWVKKHFEKASIKIKYKLFLQTSQRILYIWRRLKFWHNIWYWQLISHVDDFLKGIPCICFLNQDFIISVLLNFNMCLSHGISIPIQINVCYSESPGLPIIPCRNQPSSCARRIYPIASTLASVIYIFSGPQGPGNEHKSYL